MLTIRYNIGRNSLIMFVRTCCNWGNNGQQCCTVDINTGYVIGIIMEMRRSSAYVGNNRFSLY